MRGTWRAAAGVQVWPTGAGIGAEGGSDRLRGGRASSRTTDAPPRWGQGLGTDRSHCAPYGRQACHRPPRQGTLCSSRWSGTSAPMPQLGPRSSPHLVPPGGVGRLSGAITRPLVPSIPALKRDWRKIPTERFDCFSGLPSGGSPPGSRGRRRPSKGGKRSARGPASPSRHSPPHLGALAALRGGLVWAWGLSLLAGGGFSGGHPAGFSVACLLRKVPCQATAGAWRMD